MQLQVVPWPVIVITHVINLRAKCHASRVDEIFLNILWTWVTKYTRAGGSNNHTLSISLRSHLSWFNFNIRITWDLYVTENIGLELKSKRSCQLFLFNHRLHWDQGSQGSQSMCLSADALAHITYAGVTFKWGYGVTIMATSRVVIILYQFNSQ